MKSFKGRRQGTYAHPALFEIGRTVGCCDLLRNERILGPCKTRKYLKRDQWCERCIAREALNELEDILKRSKEHGTCTCVDCRLLAKFLKIGAENDKKHGIH